MLHCFRCVCVPRTAGNNCELSDQPCAQLPCAYGLTCLAQLGAVAIASGQMYR